MTCSIKKTKREYLSILKYEYNPLIDKRLCALQYAQCIILMEKLNLKRYQLSKQHKDDFKVLLRLGRVGAYAMKLERKLFISIQEDKPKLIDLISNVI